MATLWVASSRKIRELAREFASGTVRPLPETFPVELRHFESQHVEQYSVFPILSRQACKQAAWIQKRFRSSKLTAKYSMGL